jgi:hypothetical protein
VLAEPLDVLDGTPVSVIEPRPFTSVYRMGLEHLGVVAGEEIDEFSRVHRAALTGQQFQSANVEPVYVLFEDFTHVKFYRRSLHDGVILDGGASTASATSMTGCHSGWSRPPARTRCRADRSCAARRGTPESRRGLCLTESHDLSFIIRWKAQAATCP